MYVSHARRSAAAAREEELEHAHRIRPHLDGRRGPRPPERGPGPGGRRRALCRRGGRSRGEAPATGAGAQAATQRATSSSSGGSIGSVETCAISSKRSSTWRAEASAFGASTRTSTPRPSWASSCSAPLGAALAKFERNLMQEKQLENRRARSRPAARRPGPKPKLDEQKRALAFELHYDQGLSIADVCRKLDISRATFFRALREGPEEEKPGRKPRAKAVDRSSANRRPRAALSLVRAPVSP